ncbi:MAG: hypothetical protein EAZ42_13525 [Verrucomicrobia bacterium]|nr:MAG: hypothetical protein EAZ42_13525 [Verrucomicrobiota bacterium]
MKQHASFSLTLIAASMLSAQVFADQKVASDPATLGTTAAQRTPVGVLEVTNGDGANKTTSLVVKSGTTPAAATAAVPSLIVTSAGNVGVGVAAPGKALEVAGEVKVNTVTAGGTADSVLVVDSAGVVKKVDRSTLIPPASQATNTTILGYVPTSHASRTVPPSGTGVIEQGCKQNPANNHWYCAYFLPSSTNFYNTFNLAKSIGGYLATMTSNAERVWVNQNIVAAGTGYNLTSNIWIGYNKIATPGNEFGFRWITNEDFVIDWSTSPAATAQNWFLSGEPNNAGGNEGSVHISHIGQDSGSRKWNDVGGSSTTSFGVNFIHMIVEFDN